jgi:Protein of unknown function (DUF1570)
MKRTWMWQLCGLTALAGAFCAAIAGCQLLPMSPLAGTRPEKEPVAGAPTRHAYRVSQFVFLSDFEVQRNLPIFRELANLREQVYKDLQLPPSSTIIQVYLFEDKERYERFMHLKYPDLPKRRAFFVAQPRRIGGNEDLFVYTYWGDRVQQDLRHELTHALLHCVLRDVPLWLDEGLAEYFEVPPGWNGVNQQHVEQLRAKPQFNLERLEQLTDVQQMTPAEYREAWAWTHLMLRSTRDAKQTLLAYVQELRTNGRAGPLRPRLEKLFQNPDAALEGHLAEIGAPKSVSSGR